MPKPNKRMPSAQTRKFPSLSIQVFAMILLISSASIARGDLYGMSTVFDDNTSQLVSINTKTGAATPVEPIITPNEIWGMTYDPNTGFLVGIDNSIGSRLVSIDPLTGIFAIIGDIGLENYLVDGFTYDPNTDTFLAIDFLNKSLVKIEQATQDVTEIGVSGIQLGGGLAFNGSTNVLYGINDIFGVDDLAMIDPVTGEATIIGPTGFRGIDGLTYDPQANLLYASDYVTNQLITIDPLTGLGTAIGRFDDLPISSTDGMTTITYFPSSQVPEPSSITILFALGLGLVNHRVYQ